MAHFVDQRSYWARSCLILQLFIVFLLDLQRGLAVASGQVSETPILRSCWELKLAGFSRDGEYVIDPDGPNRGEDAFTIYCDMEKGTSIVKHNRLNRALVPRGYEDRGNYRAPVTYFGANLKQLTALADVSGNCSQFIRMECMHVLMWHENEAWSFWVSRDGIEMNNWGSPTGTRGCLCSLDQTCDKGQSKCSCDVNDRYWRKDDGLLTDKRSLPVKEMRFGDSQGTEEMAIFNLGEFKCTGQELPLYSSCEEVGKAGYEKGAYLVNVSSSSEESETEELVEVVQCNGKDEPSGDPPPMRSCADIRQAGYRTDGKYEIDPDGPQVGVSPFSVQCYLSSDLTPPIMKSCADLMLAGYSISQEYLVDPDGPDMGLPPFKVYCNLFTGTSIVRHDRKPLTQVPFGYEKEGEHRVPIHYELELEQIVSLIDSSQTCRQYLSLDCHHVLIWHKQRLINWWVSRDGENMSNWASPTGTRGCACSTTYRGCDEEEERCNCDANDLVWRKDDGYLTDKSTLPVMELRLSDTGHLAEQVFYTLGDLECSGLDTSVKASSKADGKPLSSEDTRPSGKPSGKPSGVPSPSEAQKSSCTNKSAYTGLVVGIVLIMIVVAVLVIILIVHWRSYRHLKRSGYRAGVI